LKVKSKSRREAKEFMDLFRISRMSFSLMISTCLKKGRKIMDLNLA
jgi:hypothetical protein